MTDRPIIFSAPMILALLSERKSMTRRLAWAFGRVPKALLDAAAAEGKIGVVRPRVPSLWQSVKPGDRLWVRESLTQRKGNFLGIPQNVVEAAYAADDEDVVDEREFNLLPWWKGKGGLPSIYMPRYVSRLTLVVTATKIERLQKISYVDTLAEGAPAVATYGGPEPHIIPTDSKGTGCTGKSLRAWFHHDVWNVLHGPGSWETNPELVALTFTVHKHNIDAMKEAA
jgi:hypothetical protein